MYSLHQYSSHKLKECRSTSTLAKITCWFSGRVVKGQSVERGSTAHAPPGVSYPPVQKHWHWIKLRICSQQCKYFWNRCNVSWPCRGEPNSDCVVPTAVVCIVNMLYLSGYYSIWPAILGLFRSMWLACWGVDCRTPKMETWGCSVSFGRFLRKSDIQSANGRRDTHFISLLSLTYICTHAQTHTHIVKFKFQFIWTLIWNYFRILRMVYCMIT